MKRTAIGLLGAVLFAGPMPALALGLAVDFEGSGQVTADRKSNHLPVRRLFA